MSTSSVTRSVEHPPVASTPSRRSLVQELGRRGVDRLFSRLERSRLTLQDGDSTRRYGDGDLRFPEVAVCIRNPEFYRRVLRKGALGAAESYMEGDWSCSDLTELIRALTRNIDVVDRMSGPLSWMARGRLRLAHWWNRNTVTGSRRNIHAHYDLG
ncbi:MAG: SAM-dependent methyltransferase, partial [Maioricimonas sp. JB049]